MRGSGPGLVYPPNSACNSPTTPRVRSTQYLEFQRFQTCPQSDRLRIACEFLEEGTSRESDDGEKRQEPLLDRRGALVGGRDEEQEGGGQHGADTKKHEGQADRARCQVVDGDASEGLDGEEEVVEALIEGHFLGRLGGFAVHAEDGQGARGPREGLDVEDEHVEGGGQEGCDHSDEEHGGLSATLD